MRETDKDANEAQGCISTVYDDDVPGLKLCQQIPNL